MIDKQRAKFGEHVSRLRRQVGWSQNELAAAAGLKEVTVRNIERGAFNVHFDVLNRLAVVLGGELKIVINQNK
jgi:transcriptional regulator with XRE-family HTH domain